MKYIASGFPEDVKQLIEEFVELKSMDFDDFAFVWKENNFINVYMGREEKELEQFTHEIYQLTLQFLESNNILFNIGGIYALYALYRNQVGPQPVKVRLRLDAAESIVSMLQYAVKYSLRSLHYVIEYLFENQALELVANPTLFGPMTFRRKQHNVPDFQAEYRVKELQRGLRRFQSSNAFEELKYLAHNYEKTASTVLKPSVKSISRTLIPDISALSNELNFILNGEKTVGKPIIKDNKIGQRRTEIKSSAYMKQTPKRYNLPNQEEVEEINTEVEQPKQETPSRVETEEMEPTEEEPTPPVKLVRTRQKRPRKEDRRVGRPRKNKVGRPKKAHKGEEAQETENLSDVDGQLESTATAFEPIVVPVVIPKKRKPGPVVRAKLYDN